MRHHFLSSLSYVYRTLAHGKDFFYAAGFADHLDLNTPVISVGNLTVGGTGKTPVTQLILQFYFEKQINAAVVSRNYRAQIRSAAKVDPTVKNAAMIFGDEPACLAEKNPWCSVYVGPKKWETAALAELKTRPQVIVIDDGFQHRALHRDLDIVLLDASVEPSEYQLLPLGRLREPFAALHRADFVLLTKVNFAKPETLAWLKEQIPEGTRRLEISYRLTAPLEDAGAKVIGFAGLARPESFRNSLRSDTLYDVLEFVAFPDHHGYTQADVAQLLLKKKQSGAVALVTTEKDWIKIKNFVLDPSEWRILPLRAILEGSGSTSTGEFYASLEQVARQNSHRHP